VFRREYSSCITPQALTFELRTPEDFQRFHRRDLLDQQQKKHSSDDSLTRHATQMRGRGARASSTRAQPRGGGGGHFPLPPAATAASLASPASSAAASPASTQPPSPAGSVGSLASPSVVSAAASVRQVDRQARE
jgi:hypothetical protein